MDVLIALGSVVDSAVMTLLHVTIMQCAKRIAGLFGRES